MNKSDGSILDNNTMERLAEDEIKQAEWIMDRLIQNQNRMDIAIAAACVDEALYYFKKIGNESGVVKSTSLLFELEVMQLHLELLELVD